MTKENVKMLYAHYKKMEAEGHPEYPTKLQGAIKSRGAMNRKELETARPWLLEEKPEKEEPKSKGKK